MSPKVSKFLPHFSLNFDYFLSQNCIRKLYNTTICPNFAIVGHFRPQWTIFLSFLLIWLSPRRESPPPLPPSDSVPDGGKSSLKISPPPIKKKICEEFGKKKESVLSFSCMESWFEVWWWGGVSHCEAKQVHRKKKKDQQRQMKWLKKVKIL